MNINDDNFLGAITGNSGNGRLTRSGSARTASSSESGSSVENLSSGEVRFSALANQLKALEENLGTSATFDKERVEAIRSKIAEGKYEANPKEISMGLLNTVRDLLEAQQTAS